VLGKLVNLPRHRKQDYKLAPGQSMLRKCFRLFA
jgi:hypothetical protein